MGFFSTAAILAGGWKTAAKAAAGVAGVAAVTYAVYKFYNKTSGLISTSSTKDKEASLVANEPPAEVSLLAFLSVI